MTAEPPASGGARGGSALLALVRQTPALRRAAGRALTKIMEREPGLRPLARALGVHPDAARALAEELQIELEPGRPGGRPGAA